MDAPIVEADPAVRYGDNDESVASSTTSLTESIFDYRRLHGRPYQVSETTEYWAPVDQTQNEAFDLLHNVHLMVSDNKLFLSPIGENPAKVLDVGTGTGVWAIDFAHQYPSTSVIGTDISAIQPTWVPANAKFIIEDCLLEWTFPKNHFDFVHLRALYGCVPDWEALYAGVFDHVRPGGWFEHVEREVKIESDHVKIPNDHVFNEWANLFYTGGEKMGRSFAIAGEHWMKELMEKAGFEDIHERKIKMPMHGWPKDTNLRNAGFLAQLALDQSLDGLSTFLLTQVHGWDHEQAVVFTNKFRKESRKISNYGWIWTTVVNGRKPL
ncbi:S-adenosyl-L-methionine-dependent methyltransferase [Lasiosphaeris hirsuta]|uniref:S-adenosyl-L-methionine-dependent methyltransferase n=1 Tax=Lasiosphaeris hirsuta TaxID=260670 RepID=A0AA40DG78_9PEZI|nr:S-adenosyl-L-methionine-dependent methyltransferase [Lasiosphaeris hirsuta]